MATKRRSSKVIWIRSGWLRGSIYWVLLFRGRFFATKPLSQIQRSTLWLLQGLSPRPSFGGFGLILLAMFRSIVIPVKAIALNLLSVGAAYGVLVMVFQWGWGVGVLGSEASGIIAAWLPLFLFAILFGLSMDYHMLMLNRIKGAYDEGHSNEESVSVGIKVTAGQITSAAAVMVGVFGTFALGRNIEMQQMGVGLGVAVLIDATVVRSILLPASMKLLGDRNWYLPSWLEWLPKVGTGDAAPSYEPSPEALPSAGD